MNESDTLKLFRSLLRATIVEIDKKLGEDLCSQNFMMVICDVADVPPEEQKRLFDICIKTEAKQLRTNIIEVMKSPRLSQELKEIQNAQDSKNQEDPKTDQDPKDQVSVDSFR